MQTSHVVYKFGIVLKTAVMYVMFSYRNEWWFRRFYEQCWWNTRIWV